MVSPKTLKYAEGSKTLEPKACDQHTFLVCWFVYILRCADGTYYIGQTDDLEKRMTEHAAGKGSRHTAARLPVELVHSESFTSRAQAMARQAQLKRWSRAKKEALISGDTATLKQLGTSRD